MSDLYRIVWRSRSTGQLIRSPREGGMPKAQAEACTEVLDRYYPAIKHWVEPVRAHAEGSTTRTPCQRHDEQASYA
jgi:hypothetical protein